MLTRSGDKKAQWANFEQKKLVPFNFRVQLSGSDLKNQVKHDSSVDNSKEGSDNDIQRLVEEEDKQTKQYQKKSEGNSAHAHASHATEHTRDRDGDDKHGEEDDEKKEKPEIEYKVHSEGVKVGQSSDFWNNYELDIKLAKELGEHSTVTCQCKYLSRFPQHLQLVQLHFLPHISCMFAQQNTLLLGVGASV